MRRVAEEGDGRASRTVVTDAGRAVVDVLHRMRTEHLERVTADRGADALATSTTLLDRLIVDDTAADLPGAAGTAPGTDPARGTR